MVAQGVDYTFISQANARANVLCPYLRLLLLAKDTIKILTGQSIKISIGHNIVTQIRAKAGASCCFHTAESLQGPLPKNLYRDTSPQHSPLLNQLRRKPSQPDLDLVVNTPPSLTNPRLVITQSIKISTGQSIKISTGQSIKISTGQSIKISTGQSIKISTGQSIKISTGHGQPSACAEHKAGSCLMALPILCRIRENRIGTLLSS